MMRFACIKQMEIIGEASNHLSKDLKSKFSDIKITILLLWLIETEVFQMLQLQKRSNAVNSIPKATRIIR